MSIIESINTISFKYKHGIIPKEKYDKCIVKLTEWQLNYGLEYCQSENDPF
jgi:hypothetical protein